MAHPISSRYPWRQRLVTSGWLMGLVIFLLALPPRTLNLNVFVGPDEFYFASGAVKFARALAEGPLENTYHAGQPGVTMMWVETLNIWLKYGAQKLAGQANWENLVSDDQTILLLAERRLALGITNAALTALIALLVRSAFGAGAGWITGLLLAFDPFLLTESRALRTEALLAYLGTIALLSLILYQQRPATWRLLLSGVLTALALLSKVPGLALLPVALVSISLTAGSEAQQPLDLTRRLGRVGLTLLLWGLACGLTVFLLWPALWVAPGYVAQQLYDFTFVRAVEGGGGSKSFFQGQAFLDDDPGIWFYPVVLLYRSTPLLWAGLLLLPLAWRPFRQLARRELIALGLMSLFVAGYFTLIALSFLKIDRYAIPMFPTLTIMAALGFAGLWSWLTHRRPRLHRWGWLAAAGLMAMQAALAWSNHPYYYTYWNPLLGGLQQAARVLPVGTGYEGIDQLAAYLNSLPNAADHTVASATSSKIDPLLKGRLIPMANLDGKWTQADYVMIYISQKQRGKHASDILDYLARNAPVKTVTLHGLDYGWIYPGPSADYYGGGGKLEGRGALFGYNLCTGPLPCPPNGSPVTGLAAGDTLSTRLIWRNEGQLPDDLFFVRLMDIDGYVWAEAIAHPRPGFEETARTENELVESEASLQLPAGMPPGDYFFKPGFRRPDGEIIGYFELPGDTSPLPVTVAANLPTPVEPPLPADFAAPDVKLLGYGLPATPPAPGQSFWLTLYWQATANVTHDYVILLRLLADDGSEAAYWLGRPVRSGYPTTDWVAGQLVQDPWRLELAPNIPPGTYRLEIALFDAATETEVNRSVLGAQVVISQ